MKQRKYIQYYEQQFKVMVENEKGEPEEMDIVIGE